MDAAANDGLSGAFTEPASLARQRFLHAAELVPGSADPARVLLVGGIGGDAPDQSFELVRAGEGSALGGTLTPPRTLPGVIAAPNGRLWILGGVRAANDNDALALIVTIDAAGEATTSAATSAGFPNGAAGVVTPRPELAWLRPVVAPLASGRALVSGWYGPRCTADGPPSFGEETAPCGPNPTEPSRAVALDLATGEAEPLALPVTAAFGAATSLPSGRVVLTGGVLDPTEAPVTEAVVVSAGGRIDGYTLAIRRFLHQTIAITDRAVFTFGGLTAATTAGAGELVPTTAPEVLLVRE
jgi:hypothetical protein